MSSLFDEMLEEICEKNQKIADLEAKLAEKEDRINWLVEAEFNRKWAKKYVEMRRKEDPMLCLPDSDEVYERYFELKQQLEEKDEEINVYKKYIKVEDQDKISFAVEQLEKVKEKAIKPKDYGWCDKYKDCWDIVMDIDNQIKQLKEME